MLDATFACLLRQARSVKTCHHEAFAEQRKPLQAIGPQKSAAVFCNIPRARQILESLLDCCDGTLRILKKDLITPIIVILVTSELLDTLVSCRKARRTLKE